MKKIILILILLYTFSFFSLQNTYALGNGTWYHSNGHYVTIVGDVVKLFDSDDIEVNGRQFNAGHVSLSNYIAIDYYNSSGRDVLYNIAPYMYFSSPTPTGYGDHMYTSYLASVDAIYTFPGASSINPYFGILNPSTSGCYGISPTGFTGFTCGTSVSTGTGIVVYRDEILSTEPPSSLECVPVIQQVEDSAPYIATIPYVTNSGSIDDDYIFEYNNGIRFTLENVQDIVGIDDFMDGGSLTIDSPFSTGWSPPILTFDVYDSDYPSINIFALTIDDSVYRKIKFTLSDGTIFEKNFQSGLEYNFPIGIRQVVLEHSIIGLTPKLTLLTDEEYIDLKLFLTFTTDVEKLYCTNIETGDTYFDGVSFTGSIDDVPGIVYTGDSVNLPFPDIPNLVDPTFPSGFSSAEDYLASIVFDSTSTSDSCPVLITDGGFLSSIVDSNVPILSRIVRGILCYFSIFLSALQPVPVLETFSHFTPMEQGSLPGTVVGLGFVILLMVSVLYFIKD